MCEKDRGSAYLVWISDMLVMAISQAKDKFSISSMRYLVWVQSGICGTPLGSAEKKEKIWFLIWRAEKQALMNLCVQTTFFLRGKGLQSKIMVSKCEKKRVKIYSGGFFSLRRSWGLCRYDLQVLVSAHSSHTQCVFFWRQTSVTAAVLPWASRADAGVTDDINYNNNSAYVTFSSVEWSLINISSYTCAMQL